MNNSFYATAWIIPSLILCGCADIYRRELYSDRSPPAHQVVASPVASSIPHEWHLGQTEYSDTNHDGLIDAEVFNIERHRGSDGYGRFKRDTDFDGFYDDEREQGGVAGELRWSRQIHEPVPPVTRAMIPSSHR